MIMFMFWAGIPRYVPYLERKAFIHGDRFIIIGGDSDGGGGGWWEGFEDLRLRFWVKIVIIIHLTPLPNIRHGVQ